MATGDQYDFAARLQAVLPAGWFANATTVLQGILTGWGSALATIYSQIAYTRLQTRVATATGPWLDGISADFNGGNLPRLVSEPDAAFSARIRANFFAPMGTRAAIIQALVTLTGRTPVLFQPDNTGDSGGYYSLTQTKKGGGIAYNTAGGYGNLSEPFSYFITAYRPANVGIAGVDGYGGGLGGYGVGAIEYASLSQEVGQVTDAAIQQAVVNVTDAGITAWMRISN